MNALTVLTVGVSLVFGLHAMDVPADGRAADWSARLTGEGNEYPRLRYQECRFVLVHPEPTILPELLTFPGLVRRATKHIEELGVELRAATRVAFATPQQVTLSTGEQVPTRTIISAVGTRPNPLVAGLDLEKDERGRIRVERTGLVPSRRDVWAWLGALAGGRYAHLIIFAGAAADQKESRAKHAADPKD